MSMRSIFVDVWITYFQHEQRDIFIRLSFRPMIRCNSVKIKKIQCVKTQTKRTIWTDIYCILIYRSQYCNVFVTTVNNYILNICLILLPVTPFSSDLPGIMPDSNEGQTSWWSVSFQMIFSVLTTFVLIKYFECYLSFVLHKIKLQFSWICT